ncbi:MAG: hypothetical protein GXP29_01405, partial [Planctomycetes bacterium]|nr:hypothetical protein [Planctomycetota bacterium]
MADVLDAASGGSDQFRVSASERNRKQAMGVGEQFTINTIYVAGIDNVKPSGRLRVLAVVTLLAAFAWLNVTWERMYPWAQETLALGELNIVSG